MRYHLEILSVIQELILNDFYVVEQFEFIYYNSTEWLFQERCSWRRHLAVLSADDCEILEKDGGTIFTDCLDLQVFFFAMHFNFNFRWSISL